MLIRLWIVAETLNLTLNQILNPNQGRRDGAVVRALAYNQCCPGSIPRSGVICWLSLLVLFSAPRGFLRVLRFHLLKNQHMTWFLLIINLSLLCPQLALQR